MRRNSVFLTVGAIVALQLPAANVSGAEASGDPDVSSQQTGQSGEERWVPSLAIISGVVFSEQKGSGDFSLIQGMSSPVPPCAANDTRSECRTLSPQTPIDGDDRAVVPFVGGTLELMTPALPIPTRPRLFLSAELVAAFASQREVALDGNTGCIRGPEPDAPCAVDANPRDNPYPEDSLNGTGARTTAEIGNYMYGVNLGAAFPVQFGKRQLRIKPSVGWFNYKIEAKGTLVTGFCQDAFPDCVDFTDNQGNMSFGFLRDITQSGTDSRRFNGIGPGLDIELDTGRYGPIGSAIFIGARAYHILGNRKISFSSSQSFDDQFGMDTSIADFEVEVDPWMFRVHLGIRFQWLGSAI